MAEIDNTTEAMQEYVGGHIEVVQINSRAAIVCNEDGKLSGLEYNCRFWGRDYVGPILIVGVDGPEFCDLQIPGGEKR